MSDRTHLWRPPAAIAAFSTLGCGELGIDEVLAFATARDIPSVELRTLGGNNDILDYLTGRFDTPGAFGALIHSTGIAIASIDTSIEAIGASPADRDWLQRLMPWIEASGAPRIRVFDGGKDGSDAELDSAAGLIAWWGGLTPIEMAIETHDALAQPAVLQRFLDRVPQGRILWDTFHTWKEGGENPARTWQRLQGRTAHLHVKDGRAGTYVPPGDGHYPFADLIAALDAANFDGVISLEWERHWFPDLPPLDDALDGFCRVFRSN